MDYSQQAFGGFDERLAVRPAHFRTVLVRADPYIASSGPARFYFPRRHGSDSR